MSNPPQPDNTNDAGQQGAAPPPSPEPQPTQPPGAEAAQAAGYLSAESPDAKTMGMLAHLLVIFTGFIGPLIIWLVKKDQSPFVNQQGKEALNWAITLLIVAVGSVIVALIPFIGWLVGCLGWAAMVVSNIVFGILSTIEVNKGNPYRYPICIRFIS